MKPSPAVDSGEFKDVWQLDQTPLQQGRVRQRGDAIYENDVRPQLKADDDGKFAAIDIESRMYEVDGDELAACDKLRAKGS